MVKGWQRSSYYITKFIGIYTVDKQNMVDLGQLFAYTIDFVRL